MTECANIDPLAQGVQAVQFVADVESVLRMGRNQMLRIDERLLPAHLVALLKPISKKSAELAELLHPLRRPFELRDITSTINDNAYHAVHEINTEADLLIVQLRQGENKGLHHKVSSKALAGALESLGKVFDKYAIEPSREDRQEFLKTCRSYLPRVK
jgi:hypothetical protein